MTQKRGYEVSHPWLTFNLDMRQLESKLWYGLGEAASKCEHIAGVPLDPETAEKMHTLYLAKGALATTAIEGNTLSEDEAKDYLDGKLSLPPSREYLGRELRNIVGACNTLTNELAKDGVHHPFTVDKIKWMNAQVLDGLDVDEDVIPGEIRHHSVVVGRYRCAPAEDCHYLLGRLCEVLNNFPTDGEIKAAIAVIKAVFAHLYLVWIHPFGDGNGRTARLLELNILLAAGLPQPTGHLLSNHYNKTRSEYYRRLDSASRSETGVIDFIRYATRGFVDGLREQISYIRERQWQVAWTNYVHQQFQGVDGTTAARRRNLVLWLSQRSEPIKTSKYSDFILILPQGLGFDYMTKTSRTLQRDIDDLIKMGLLRREKGGAISANKEMILAFLPWRHIEKCDKAEEGEPK